VATPVGPSAPPPPPPPQGQQPGYFEIRVSANLLTFPRMCCCCGRTNQPGTTYIAHSTRTTGVRVIRHQTKKWSFPLCEECDDWIRAVRRIPRPFSPLGVYLLAALAVALTVCCWLPAFGAITPPPTKDTPSKESSARGPAAKGSTAKEPTSKQPTQPEAAKLSPVTGGVCGLVSLGAAGILAYGGHAFAARRATRVRKARAAADAIRPDSSCHPTPVEYLGWRGTVHRFAFTNPDFSDAFERANAKKVVR